MEKTLAVPRYSTAFTYLVLAGTSSYYVYQIVSEKTMCFQDASLASYSVILLNSVIGTMRNTKFAVKHTRKYNQKMFPVIFGLGEELDQASKFTECIQSLFATACFSTSLWLSYDYSPKIAFANIVIPFILLGNCLSKNENLDETGDKIKLANCVSMTVISILGRNLYGIATAIMALISEFAARKEWLIETVPNQDLANLFMFFATHFAFEALQWSSPCVL